MSFMQHEITSKQNWWQVETKAEGLVSYPCDMFSRLDVANMHGVLAGRD